MTAQAVVSVETVIAMLLLIEGSILWLSRNMATNEDVDGAMKKHREVYHK